MVVRRYHDPKQHMEESLFGRRVPKEEVIRQERQDSQEAATEPVAGTGGAKTRQNRNWKWDKVLNSQSRPPVTFFLQQGATCKRFPNVTSNTMNWRPRVQTHEPMGLFFTQTTMNL